MGSRRWAVGREGWSLWGSGRWCTGGRVLLLGRLPWDELLEEVSEVWLSGGPLGFLGKQVDDAELWLRLLLLQVLSRNVLL